MSEPLPPNRAADAALVEAERCIYLGGNAMHALMRVADILRNSTHNLRSDR